VTPEHWEQLRGLLASALELPPESRTPEYLDRLCDGDHGLVIELEELIAAHESPGAAKLDALELLLPGTEWDRLLENAAAEETLSDGLRRTATRNAGSQRTQPPPTARPQCQSRDRPGELRDVLIGQTVGSYRVEALIGIGGMGKVYRARDTRLDRSVAIKVLPSILTHEPERLKRFEREGRILASLNHTHIAAIYDLEESDDSRALVLELVEGETLGERIQRGPLPVRDAIDIARQIADALEATHTKGIVHRDLKPANVKIRYDGIVKVLDFGVATSSPSWDRTALTRSRVNDTDESMIPGTAAYMSDPPVYRRTHVA
jgi:hypothetical protein